MDCSLLKFVANVIGLILCLFKVSYSQSNVKFCDGEDLFVINDGDCNSGLTFGNRQPECVCVTGAYRIWTDECEIYDGFTSNYCFLLWDDGSDINYNLQGLRLIPGVANLYTDTIAVFNSNETTSPQNWKAVRLGENAELESDSFYIVNGFSVVLQNNNDKFICVEPVVKTEKSVCKYYSSDNLKIWNDGEKFRIGVMDSCNVMGYTMVQMREHRCYDILDQNSSDCNLTCKNGNISQLPGSLSTLQQKLDSTSTHSTENSPLVSRRSPTLKSTYNAKFFMHYKLDKYTRLRQTGQLYRPDLSRSAPNHTFLLMEISKSIARKFCPRKYVSSLFLNQAFELFIVLHKGQELQYMEDIPERDFNWISDILWECRKDGFRLPVRDPYDHFEGINTGGSCEYDDYIDRYAYKVNGSIERIKLSRGSDHRQGKFHYIIDAVWFMLDLTNVLCNQFFQKAYRMLHVWEQASEKLFTRDIRHLWFDPQVDSAVYKALLSPRALFEMINLERCVEAAYGQYGLRELRRPDDTKFRFKRRKRETSESGRVSVAKYVDVYCIKEDEQLDLNC